MIDSNPKVSERLVSASLCADQPSYDDITASVAHAVRAVIGVSKESPKADNAAVLGVSKESPMAGDAAELGVSNASPNPDAGVELGVSKESPKADVDLVQAELQHWE